MPTIDDSIEFQRERIRRFDDADTTVTLGPVIAWPDITIYPARPAYTMVAKEDVPAPRCQMVAFASSRGAMKVWADGFRLDFLFVEDCVTATTSLMRFDFRGSVNIGSEEMVSTNYLARLVIQLSNKDIAIENIPGSQGVRSVNSDNRLIEEKLGWIPNCPLKQWVEATYSWVLGQLKC